MQKPEKSAALGPLTNLLARFPKQRSTLPPRYAAFHEQFYKAAREGGHAGASIALKLERWMHRQASRTLEYPLLEIGAGTLNHVQFEQPLGDYDVVEPMAALYRDRPEHRRIRNLYNDIGDIPADRRYRRIVSIATLEHVTDLPVLIARSALLLEQEGVFRAGIPSEGGLAWYIAYMLGTGTTFRLKYGMSYSKFMRYEHVNDASEVESIVRLFYENVSIRRYPLPSLHASIYSHIEAYRPKVDASLQYLANRGTR